MPKTLDITKEKILTAYDDTDTQKTLSQKLGIGLSTLRRYLTSLDIDILDRKFLSDKTILTAYKDNDSRKDLAKKLDCSEGSIRKYVVRNGGLLSIPRKRNLLSITKEMIISEYKPGDTLVNLSEKLDTNTQTLKRYLKQFDIENIAKQPRKPPLSKDEILTNYSPNDSLKTLSKKLNIWPNTLRRYLDILDIRLPRWRPHPIDENFFKSDTEFSFYLAGYIMADGCITSASKTTDLKALSIVSKDYDHLAFIRDILSPHMPLFEKVCKDSLRNLKWKDSITYSIHITSNVYANDLKRFDIGERKSLTATFPDWLINHPLVHHFLRGYFDGDGSVCLPTKQSHPGHKMIHIRGTHQFLQTFNYILSIHCSKVSSVKTTNKDSGINSLQYNGVNICNQIAQFLYCDATIFLPRKHDIFLTAPSYLDYKSNE